MELNPCAAFGTTAAAAAAAAVAEEASVVATSEDRDWMASMLGMSISARIVEDEWRMSVRKLVVSIIERLRAVVGDDDVELGKGLFREEEMRDAA